MKKFKVYVKIYHGGVCQYSPQHPVVKDPIYVGTTECMDWRRRLDAQWAKDNPSYSRAQALHTACKVEEKIIGEFDTKKEAEDYELEMIKKGLDHYGDHRKGGRLLNLKKRHNYVNLGRSNPNKTMISQKG